MICASQGHTHDFQNRNASVKCVGIFYKGMAGGGGGGGRVEGGCCEFKMLSRHLELRVGVLVWAPLSYVPATFLHYKY